MVPTSLPELPKLSRTAGQSQKPIIQNSSFSRTHLEQILNFCYSFLIFVGFKNSGFQLFPGVLEGLGSSGKLVGTISTYPGTYQCPGSRVMAKNLGGIFLTVHYIYIYRERETYRKLWGARRLAGRVASPFIIEHVRASGGLVGTISTHPGTCSCPWSRVIAKNPPGGICLSSTVGPFTGIHRAL